jgi:hypothetical protein
LDLLGELIIMNKSFVLGVLLLITAALTISSNILRNAYADNTWYVGKGVQPNT